MGVQDVQLETHADRLRVFMKSLLGDVRALERMIETGMIETGVRRIGAEQEMFLVDRQRRPAPVAEKTLRLLDDPHFSPELGLFNLECNADPLRLTGDCLSRLETQLSSLIEKARKAANEINADVVLAGILPTLTKSDLGLENMTPRPRYKALNDGLTRLRDGEYDISIKGHDELMFKHDSVMLESCNASFQVHFQVGPDEFARLYNMAQAAAGPVLAAATNSPILFGKKLWAETRIALFEQSVDTRGRPSHPRDQMSRVSFGSGWAQSSAMEIFKDDIARFRAFLSTSCDEDALSMVQRGQVPQLAALRLHNSTVYRWSRVCYGVCENVAHLRIENRILPSGPSLVDEIANAALWFGVVAGLAHEYEDITQIMRFEDARSNFFAAARHGLDAQLIWLDGEPTPAARVLLDHVIPLARRGLLALHVDEADVDQRLDLIEQRVASGQTGSRWALKAMDLLDPRANNAQRMSAITEATLEQQRRGRPVHLWPLDDLAIKPDWSSDYQLVEQCMTTDLFTVNQDELIDLVAAVMDWRHIRHIPVEDDAHRLVGIVTHRALLRLLASGDLSRGKGSIPVSAIMTRDVVTISPKTPTTEAIQIMRSRRVGSLPVVENGRLVGIITDRDFLDIAADLIERRLASCERNERRGQR